MRVLIIDTSYSNAFSVGLLVGNQLFSVSSTFYDGNSNSTYFWSILEKLFEISKVKKSEIDIVSVSVGPGPFTSLRNGISVARTISQIKGIPMTKFSLLEIVEYMFQKEIPITLFDGRGGKLLVKKPNVEGFELVKVKDFKPPLGSKVVSVGCKRILYENGIDVALNFDFLPMDTISEVVKKKIALGEFYQYNEVLPIYYKNL